MDIIVLCGGQGTRLRSVVSNVPKPLAPVGDGVFLDHVLEQYFSSGFETATLSAGYMSDKIKDYADNSPFRDRLRVIVEPEPLGTGGAIAHCLEHLPDKQYLVVNGDTYLKQLTDKSAEILRSASEPFAIIGNYIGSGNADRFGAFKVDDHNLILHELPNINDNKFVSLGLYLIDRAAFRQLELPPVPFSIDDCVRHMCATGSKAVAIPLNIEFIDIGVPEDYTKFLLRHAPG